MTDRTELRRLLDEPRGPRQYRRDHYNCCPCRDCKAMRADYMRWWRARPAAGAGARVPVVALTSVLDQLDAAEAALARVRELHERESFWQYHRDQEHSYLTQQDAADESGCDCPEDPDSVYLAHTAECLATISHFDVCSGCARIEYADAERQAHGDFSGYAEALWPCPTIAAVGGES